MSATRRQATGAVAALGFATGVAEMRAALPLAGDGGIDGLGPALPVQAATITVASASPRRPVALGRALLAVRIERVEERPGCRALLLIVGVVQLPDAIEQRLDPQRLRRDRLVVGIGATNHPSTLGHRGIRVETELVDEGLASALRPGMAEHHTL